MKAILMALLLAASLVAQVTYRNINTEGYTFIVWYGNEPHIGVFVQRTQNQSAENAPWISWNTWGPDVTPSTLLVIPVVHTVITYDDRPCVDGRRLYMNAHGLRVAALSTQHQGMTVSLLSPWVPMLSSWAGSFDSWVSYCPDGELSGCSGICPESPEMVNWWESPQWYIVIFKVSMQPADANIWGS